MFQTLYEPVDPGLSLLPCNYVPPRRRTSTFSSPYIFHVLVTGVRARHVEYSINCF